MAHTFENIEYYLYVIVILLGILLALVVIIAGKLKIIYLYLNTISIYKIRKLSYDAMLPK